VILTGAQRVIPAANTVAVERPLGGHTEAGDA
jgi:hypothetical protein